MTRAQAKLLAEFGPFELSGDVILDANGVGLWGIAIRPPAMGVDHAIVAALNHVVAEEKARQLATRARARYRRLIRKHAEGK